MIEQLMSSSLSGDQQGCAARLIWLHVGGLRYGQQLNGVSVVCECRGDSGQQWSRAFPYILRSLFSLLSFDFPIQKSPVIPMFVQSQAECSMRPRSAEEEKTCGPSVGLCPRFSPRENTADQPLPMRSPSLVPERDQRIDAGCAVSGDIAGCCCHDGHDGSNYQQSRRISRAYAEQQTLQQARET